jgi:hypothetical protein
MSSGSEDTEENESWIQWFCRMKGNEYFCEVCVCVCMFYCMVLKMHIKSIKDL